MMGDVNCKDRRKIYDGFRFFFLPNIPNIIDMRSLFTSATCLLNVISINDHMDAVKRKQKRVLLLCVVMHTYIQKNRFQITGRVSKDVRSE